MVSFVRQAQSIPPSFAMKVTTASMARSKSVMPENINLARVTLNASTVQQAYNVYQIPLLLHQKLQSLVNVLLDHFVMALAQVSFVPLEHIVILLLVKIKFRNVYHVHMVTSVRVVLVNSQVTQYVTMDTNVTKVLNR